MVVLIEGESNCHTLWFQGIAALGIPGARIAMLDTWRVSRREALIADTPTSGIRVARELDRAPSMSAAKYGSPNRWCLFDEC
jgi:hypothetical protein